MFPLKKDCFTTSITLLGLKKFGFESLLWLPEILRDNFLVAFDILKLPQRLFDKLNCGYMMVGTNGFTNTIEGFLTGTCITNNRVFEEDLAPFCTFKMCAWSIWEYMTLSGLSQDGKPVELFSPDVILYIRQAGNLNGITKYPEWMKFAEKPDMPDLTGDVQLFLMYLARQNEYVDQIQAWVAERQQQLAAELKLLANMGLIGPLKTPVLKQAK